jgi:hypothetical protein
MVERRLCPVLQVELTSPFHVHSLCGSLVRPGFLVTWISPALITRPAGLFLAIQGLCSAWPRHELILWLLLHRYSHLAENL